MTETEHEQRKIESRLKRYSASYMSNAKWRKLFSLINKNTVDLNQCTWKLITHDTPINGWLPDEKQMGEDYVGDCGALNGPFFFRIIEWVLIPARVAYREYEHGPEEYLYQDVQQLQTKLDGVGMFEYKSDGEGLKIFGYK